MLRCVLNLINNSIFERTVEEVSCVVGLLCYVLNSSFEFLFREWNPTKIVLYMKKSMLHRALNLLNHSIFGRTVEEISCVVGLLCYVLNSSFEFLFREWNPTKIVLYMKKSMLHRVLNLLNHSIFGRTVGSLSCVVGLLSYALSSSFKFLFGEWNHKKIVLYIILSSIISVVVIFEAKSRVSFVSKLKPHVQFLVLMLTSLYSFFTDRSTKGKPDTWSVVSSVAFALTSLCLSRQIKPGFDVGLFNFFLGCVTVQLMKIHLIFILVAAGLCYPLVVLGSYSESQSENGDSSAEEIVEILIDDGNRASFGMGQDRAGHISPRRRVRNVSPSPSPSPSTRLTQDDDRSSRTHSGQGGSSSSSSSSSNDAFLARLPAHGNKKFEKLPEVAATEQFLSDLQELERWPQPQPQKLRRQQERRRRKQLQVYVFMRSRRIPKDN